MYCAFQDKMLLFSRCNIIYRLQITILHANRATRLKCIFSCEKSIYVIIAITKLVHIFFLDANTDFHGVDIYGVCIYDNSHSSIILGSIN